MIKSDVLIQVTKQLVSINSISRTKNDKGIFNENILADFIVKTAKRYSLPTTLIPTPDGRNGVSIFLKGKMKETIVLIAHHDTVGIEDMDGLYPFDIDKNSILYKNNKYFYGRGAGDMKAGIAVGIGVMEDLSHTDLTTNVVFISVPDEENESTGILAAIKYLKSLQDKYGYKYIGVLNLDSGLQDENHPERKVAEIAGVIGKLLPCFFVVGKSSHASDPFEGISSTDISSSIIAELDANPAYCDFNKITKKFSPPPICLKATDLKDEYNTQLPLKSFLYFNYHTYQENPYQVLQKMKKAATIAANHAMQTNKKNYTNFIKKQKVSEKNRAWTKIAVYTFGEILDIARKRSKNIENELQIIINAQKGADARDINVKLIEYVAKIASITSPYIVCFFSKPYYPSSYEENTFTDLVTKTIKKFANEEKVIIDIVKFSEGISDMNYMQIDKKNVQEAHSYLDNNPLAKLEGDIDIDSLASISMPIACLGPSAFNPHQREEKVEIAYTFDLYPKLLLAIIHNLQQVVAKTII